MSRPRVLYVNHVAFLGGAERSLLGLLEALDRDAVEPLLAAPEGALTDEGRRLGIECVGLPFGRLHRRAAAFEVVRSAGRLLAAAWRIRPLAARVDLIHANSAPAALAACLLPRRAKLVWHVRDLAWPPGLVRFVGRRADAVIAISQAVADRLRAVGMPPERIVVLANALDPEAFVGATARAAGQARGPAPAGGGPAAEVVFVCVGNLIPWKRQDLLLEAFAQLGEWPEARLWFVGDDPFGEHRSYAAGLETRAARPDLAGRVTFLGRVEMMPDVLAAADVLVLPSDDEPFGRVLLEAAACRLPVIATAAGGVPEVVRHGVTGLLVAPGDAAALAGAMRRMLAGNRPYRRRLGDAGHDLLRRGFAPASHAAAVLAVYRRLLRE